MAFQLQASSTMQASELEDIARRTLVRRGGTATTITITQDWVMRVQGADYDVRIVLTPERRNPASAVEAVRRVAPWAVPWDESSNRQPSQSV